MHLVEIDNSPEILERIRAELALVDDVAHWVHRQIGRAIEFEELVSAGREGLLDAARRYDPNHGVPFRAFANLRIRGAIWDSVRRNATLPRRVYQRVAAEQAALRMGTVEAPRAAAEPSDLPDATHEQNMDRQLATTALAAALNLARDAAETLTPSPSLCDRDPEEAFARAELIELVRREAGQLSPREGEVVRLRYLEGQSFATIAATLGIDDSWINRLHKRAIEELARRVKGRL